MDSEEGHLPAFDYLVLWKGNPEEENTWKPASAIQHLQRLISTYHREHPEKPTATKSSTYLSGLGAGTSFDFPLWFSCWVWEVFHRSILEFPPQLPFKVSEVFSHQIPKDRFFLLEVFSTTFHHNSYQPPNARRNTRSKRKVIVMMCSRDQAMWPVLVLLHLPRYHHQAFHLRPYHVTLGTTFRPCATFIGTKFRSCQVRHPFRFTIRPARDRTHLQRAKTFSSQLSPLATSLNIISRIDTIAQCHPARVHRSMLFF